MGRWTARDTQAGGWVLQLLMVLAVVAAIGYEALAIGATALAVDDGARQVASTARDAYRASGGSLDRATEAAVEAAAVHRATVTDVALDGEELSVTLQRRAPTLVVHRIAATADLTVRTATARASTSLR